MSIDSIDFEELIKSISGPISHRKLCNFLKRNGIKYYEILDEIIDVVEKLGYKVSSPDMSWTEAVHKRSAELNGMKTTQSYIDHDLLYDCDFKFKIHDNGGRPFVFKTEFRSIFLSKNDHNLNPTTFKKIDDFEGFWIGFDTTPYCMHGNTILIKISCDEYVFVGREIYSFKTEDEITDYYSPVGNSDVPYPLAIGDDNVYFMLEHKFKRKMDVRIPITLANALILYNDYTNSPGNSVHNMDYKMIIENK